jgi:SAM-dependent methyltransferase
MPGLDSKLHLDMLAGYKEKRSLRNRLSGFLKKGLMDRKVYGLSWGDPETAEPLRFLRDRYLLPYVKPEQDALEIGPGGGRWTRYLLPFHKVYVVDYHQELLDELRRNFRKPNMVFIKNHGSDFPGVPAKSVDFVFTFGTFVHLDTPIIETYMKNIREVLRPGGNAIVHYSDKTKIMARENTGFSENTPDKMRQIVLQAGFKILEEDLTTMWHSSLMRLTI